MCLNQNQIKKRCTSGAHSRVATLIQPSFQKKRVFEVRNERKNDFLFVSYHGSTQRWLSDCVRDFFRTNLFLFFLDVLHEMHIHRKNGCRTAWVSPPVHPLNEPEVHCSREGCSISKSTFFSLGGTQVRVSGYRRRRVKLCVKVDFV